MSKEDEIINEINKTRSILSELPKPIKKIKMKEEFYNNLAKKVQEQYRLVEVLDKDMQPLNNICAVKIEIDNSIEKEYEIEY